MGAARHGDKPRRSPICSRMRRWLVIIPLLAAAGAGALVRRQRLGAFRAATIPFYGYVAIAGGVLFSLLVGGGLMALVFYSSRHGYDD